MTTDLGLDWLSSMDLFVVGLCIILTLLAFKMRSFPFCVVASFAWLAEGLQIFLVSEQPMPFLIMFTITAGIMLYGMKWGELKL